MSISFDRTEDTEALTDPGLEPVSDERDAEFGDGETSALAVWLPPHQVAQPSLNATVLAYVAI